MSGAKRKRNVLNVKQKLEILQKLDKGESVSTDAEDVLNEGNTVSHSAALQSVETLLDYMGQRGFDYGDITAEPFFIRLRSTEQNIKVTRHKTRSRDKHTDKNDREASWEKDGCSSATYRRKEKAADCNRYTFPFLYYNINPLGGAKRTWMRRRRIRKRVLASPGGTAMVGVRLPLSSDSTYLLLEGSGRGR
ncbi:hypothetical protein AVEN_18346-1 [Araneus ventricosus]|uniref:HTH psq-type domain-containing protein n=1 Tax=Araneus ventricosus TaxID=182803 RepID=A0A4Y2H939_ARAVE|nr:hypothetical protein AVEN_18346-1 [Araneus ventricosus]